VYDRQPYDILEGKVVSVDTKRGTCVVNLLNGSKSTDITDVPLPYMAGTGGAGLFYGIKENSRVIVAFTSFRSRNVTVILGLIPEVNLYPSNYTQNVNLPYDTLPYIPLNSPNDLIITGGIGSTIKIDNDGDISLETIGKEGLIIKKLPNKSATYLRSHDLVQYSDAGRLIFGAVRRKIDGSNSDYPDPSVSPLFCDVDFHSRSNEIGLFTNGRVRNSSRDGGPRRNPLLTEYRFVINEFATDSMFTGFDDESSRSSGKFKLWDNRETSNRFKQQGNLLYLSENELIEFVGGNLVDINGRVLDINYKPLTYGDNNLPPAPDELEYERVRRTTRRGIGYHMQLTTNSRKSDPSKTTSNFVFDIDKEGLLKLNIPKNTSSGNIPFVSTSNFATSSGNATTKKSNGSKVEPIPVALRDENGTPVFFPLGKDNQKVVDFRNTGIRYYSSSGETRINPTKYHNMYAAAERLIANTIRNISIPSFDIGEVGATQKPFEVPEKNQHKDRATVVVSPGTPAVYWGGGGGENTAGTIIAGQYYSNNDSSLKPYSNEFLLDKNGSQIIATPGTEEQPAEDPGGKSVNANIEGSIELSVGKDNYDQKSIILDTAGSIISWLGKDKNGRSAVIQTDGAVLMNIGGSYKNTSTEPGQEDSLIMNKGRFDLRVNVTDKKFYSTENANTIGCNSDYIISISEEGIVIAGTVRDKPMVIRNEGNLLIESSNELILKGQLIRTVDSTGIKKTLDPNKVSDTY
jgi:hypothetical protein